MNNFAFWNRWLRILSLAIVAFGIIMALFNGTVVFKLFNDNIDPVFWSAISEDAVDFKSWVYGGWGATIAGWGIVLYFVATHAFPRREPWVWNAIALGLTAWYVIDTFLSIAHQVYFNAAFNTLILILAGLPLIFTKSMMRKD
jgi:hypothetical protein